MENIGWRDFHKRIRLDAVSYAQAGAVCSVTVAVRDRQPVFGDPAVARGAVDVLRSLATKTGVPVYTYCIMPDHVHLILTASPTCDMITFVGQYKSLAQRAAWQRGVKGTFWQKSFWDHFLRSNEDFEAAVRYALENPVRKGMVEKWDAYEFSGSLVFDL